MVGEPTASGKPGQFRLESEIDYASRDIDVGGSCCMRSETLRLLVKFSSLVHDRVELFGRLGGVVLQTLQVPASPDVKGSPALAGGGGFKITLYKEGSVGWGMGGQVVYDESKDSGQSATLTWYEVDLFTGPTVTIRPGVDLYGGLLGSLVTGQLHGAGGSADLEQQKPVGLFFGGQVTITRSVFFGLEMRLINELSIASRAGVVF